MREVHLSSILQLLATPYSSHLGFILWTYGLSSSNSMCDKYVVAITAPPTFTCCWNFYNQLLIICYVWKAFFVFPSFTFVLHFLTHLSPLKFLYKSIYRKTRITTMKARHRKLWRALLANVNRSFNQQVRLQLFYLFRIFGKINLWLKSCKNRVCCL